MSTVTLRLPDPTNSGTPEEFLKQLELCVHHARKAVAVQREDQDETASREDDYVSYISESLFSEIESIKADEVPMDKSTVQDRFWELLQNLEIKITIN